MHGLEFFPERVLVLPPAVFHRLRTACADPRLHEFLWFSVPGVTVALLGRAWLMTAMPWGFYHPDTHDFLTGIYFLEAHHHWAIHGKTTFLTPVLYAAAFFVPRVPALIVIPFAQHLRGLLTVLMIGGLCRLWCVRWRWWIVPLTLLAAVQPAMIFWEHALVSESGFVFGAVALALAGTVFARRPGTPGFVGLLAAMALVAAARPEGNLWLGAGMVTTLIVYRGCWRREWMKIAAAVVLSLVMLSLTKVSHSGLLLYSSLVHLSPDEPRAVPGFGPYIRPLRDRTAARRRDLVSDDVVRTSKRINEALTAYATDHPNTDFGLPAKGRSRRRSADPHAAVPEPAARFALRTGNNLSNICRWLAMECAWAHPFRLPGIVWRKFLAPINADSGGRFEEHAFHEKQAFSLVGKPDIARTLTPALAGILLESKEQGRAFVDQHYDLDKVRWFNRLESAWQAVVGRVHLPASRFSDHYEVPGLPLYHLLAMLGALTALCLPGPARRFHCAFVPCLCGAMFVVMLTAAVIPRHRFVLEPFLLLYGCCLLDAVAVLASCRTRLPARPSVWTADAPAALPM